MRAATTNSWPPRSQTQRLRLTVPYAATASHPGAGMPALRAAGARSSTEFGLRATTKRTTRADQQAQARWGNDTEVDDSNKPGTLGSGVTPGSGVTRLRGERVRGDTRLRGERALHEHEHTKHADADLPPPRNRALRGLLWGGGARAAHACNPADPGLN